MNLLAMANGFVRAGFRQNGFFADFYFWAAGFFRGFSRRIFSPHFWGEKVPRKILQENPRKILQNVYNKNPPAHFCRLPRASFANKRATFPLSLQNSLQMDVCDKLSLVIANALGPLPKASRCWQPKSLPTNQKLWRHECSRATFCFSELKSTFLGIFRL